MAADGDEVIIISGPAQFSGSRLNNQMSVPGSVWKIAVEIPNATSTTPANQRITTSARVIALLTPNTSTGLGPWQSYITSVEAIEDVTGFNFFDAITNQSTAVYLKNLVDTGTGPNNPTVVTRFDPTLGGSGSSILIHGFNFTTASTVQFNGVDAQVTYNNANQLTAIVPPGAASGPITVTGPGGTDTSYEPFTVTAGALPTLGVNPSSLSSLTANEGSPGSAAVYALSGSNLTNQITITAPGNFEVSKDGVSFTNTQILDPEITGAVGAQLYVRIKGNAAAGDVSGAVSHASGSATASLNVAGNVVSSAPNLSLSTTNITGLSALQNSPGTSVSYAVSGANLNSNITVAASAGFQVSADNISFASSVNLSPSSGTLSNATVYIRLAASGTPGTVTGTVTHSGGGISTDKILYVSGNVASTAPALTLSTNSISGFTAVQNNPGGSKSYTVSGTFLTSAVSIGAPNGFEIGTNTTTFTNSLVLVPLSGTLPSTTIYARLAASTTTGSRSGSITNTSGGVAPQEVNITGNVNPPSSGGTNETLARWTFESFSNGITGTTLGPVYPEAGLQTNSAFVSGLHVSSSTAYTNFTGNGSAKALSANNWTTNDYFQFEVGMSGYQGLKLRFDQTGSGTGPAQFRISYSTNGSTYVTFTNYDVPKTNSTAAATWSSGASNAASTILIDLSAVADLNDSVRAYLRLTPRSTNSINNGGVAATGTSRIDNIIVEATTVGSPISPKPIITSAATATGAAQVPFEYLIKADNSPTYFGASGLPAGLSVDNTTGRISGTPTIPGSYIVLLTASNASGDGTTTLTLQIAPVPVPVITSATTASAAVGAPFSYQIEASNTPTAYLADNLPTGLAFNSLTGTISGTPTSPGATDVVITAINALGSDQGTLTITVLAPVISVSQTGLAFTNSFGQPSAAETYELTGQDLAEAVTVLAPGNFEINDDGSTNYLDELTIAPAPDRTINATISVRMKASAPLGENSGAIINSGANAVPKYVQLTGFSDVAAATLDLSTWNLTGFSTKTGTPSLTQSYTVSGVGLTEPVTVTAPTGFQISNDNNSFGSALTVAPDGSGNINAQEIFVRLSSATAGTFTGSIAHTGGGAADRYLAVSGAVTAPIGPPIISPLSGSAYTGASFRTRIIVGGSLAATSFAASGLTGTLQINTTNGTVSGNVPNAAGTNVFSLSASTQDGTTTTNYNLRVVSAAQQNSIPTSVVINKFQNGLPDRIELLVIGDTNDAAPGPPVDMRGMVLKDFSSGRTADEGGEYRFAEHEAWSKVKAGTLIVVSAGTQSTEDLEPEDFVLRVNLGNAALFKQESPNFDIDDLEMIMIKPASMGVEGFAGGIHALAAGRVSGTTIYGLYTGKKIRSDRSLNNSRTTVYATASSLSGYNSTEDDAALASSGLEFGIGNTTPNRSYITSLRNLDQTPPTITLNVTNPLSWPLGVGYIEPVATAFDTGDNQNRPVTKSGSVNISAAGRYEVFYTATDSKGNQSILKLEVNVAKGTPTITQVPTASAIIAGQKLSASTLTGGSASVPGTFAWTNPNQVVSAAGMASYEATFTPTDAANYNPATTTVSVTANQGTAFESWIAGFELAGDSAASTADPDRDGLNNALEFDLGRSPTRGDGWARSVGSANGQLRVTYLQRKGANFTVQTSSDLASGFSATASPSLTSPQPGDISSDYEQYEVTIPPVNGRAFLRIRATQP
jgi:hypothetical protein